MRSKTDKQQPYELQGTREVFTTTIKGWNEKWGHHVLFTREPIPQLLVRGS